MPMMVGHDNHSHKIIVKNRKIYKNQRSGTGYIALQYSQFSKYLPNKVILIIRKGDVEITETIANVSHKNEYTQFISIPANVMMLILLKTGLDDHIPGDLILSENDGAWTLEFNIKEEKEGDAP